MLYSGNFDEKTMARVQGVSLPISLKQSAEVCSAIRNKKYERAVRILEDVIEMKTAISYTKFNRGGTGHRKGMGPGRYPIKTSGMILKLLQSVNANARQKGLDVNSLTIKTAVAKQGPKVPRYGRKRGRTAKRTHIEIIVAETKKDPKASKTEKPVKKTPVQKVEEKKPTVEVKKAIEKEIPQKIEDKKPVVNQQTQVKND